MIDKLNFEKKILHISLAGSIVFVLAECIMAYITKSNSILMDCVFDTADVVMIGPFLMLVPLLYKPVTEERPYGFSQMESLFVIIKCSILVVITIQLVFSNVGIILKGGNRVDAGIVAIFEMSLCVASVLIYTLLKHYNKTFSSPSIKADLFMWKMDILASLGVSLAFGAQMFLEDTSFSWAVPYIDPAVAIVMAVWLIVEPIKMIVEGLKNLVLFAPKEEIMENIRAIANKHLEGYPYTINFLDVIQTGRKAWIQVYLEGEEDLISMSQLRLMRGEIKRELRECYDEVYVELIPDFGD